MSYKNVIIIGEIAFLQTNINKKMNNQVEEDFSDENFAYIAGYTSGGVPFGLTHEEAGNIFEE